MTEELTITTFGEGGFDPAAPDGNVVEVVVVPADAE